MLKADFLSLHTSFSKTALLINCFLQLFHCKVKIINCCFCFIKQLHCSIGHIPKYNKWCTDGIDGLKGAINTITDAAGALKEILRQF